MSTSRRAPRKASSSSGVPIVTRRQPSRRGHDAQFAHEHRPRSTSCFHTSSPASACGRNSTKLAPGRPRRRPAGRRARPATRPRSSTRCARRAPPSALRNSRATRPGGSLGERVQVVGQDDLLELVDDPAGPDEVPEAQRRRGPRLGVRPGDHDRAVLAVDEAEGGDRRELAVRLVDDEQVRRPRRPRRGRLRTSSGGSTRPVGLLGEQRKVRDRTPGRGGSPISWCGAGIDGEVVGAVERRSPRYR